MISIIIPVYNQAAKLARCLDSISRQTYQDYEVIIVNDGSSDNIEQTISRYRQQFTKFKVIDQNNQGSNPARNRGAEQAKGEFIIFCDADIIMEPLMLETMLQALRDNPAASYVYSSFKYGAKTFRLWPFDPAKLKQLPYIHTSSLIRREHFPGFDEKIKRLQDWDLWLTMLKSGRTGVWINQILFKVQAGGAISNWLPSIAYKLLLFLPQVKKYQRAVRLIKDKHRL